MATRPVESLRTKEYDALRGLLRETRESAGIHQEELSKRLARPISYIGKVETGTRRLDLVELYQIAKVLNVDLVAFIQKFIQNVDSSTK